jgi:hypothetical protein
MLADIPSNPSRSTRIQFYIYGGQRLQLLSLICNLAFFICFEQDLSLGCVHLSYAEAGCKLNNFLSNKALFIEKKTYVGFNIQVVPRSRK